MTLRTLVREDRGWSGEWPDQGPAEPLEAQPRGGAGLDELRMQLFGVPEVWLGGRPVVLRRRSSLALLAYLSVTGRSHPREALAAFLADDAGDQAARLLCNAMYELRAVVGGHLLVTPKEAGLAPDAPRVLDVAVYRTALETALAAGDIPGASRALRLYQDEFLAGLVLRDAPQFESWLLQQREELLVLTVRGLQAVVDHHARHGPPEAGIAAARRLLALEPWREEAHRQLMVLLARAGQRSAALKQFETCRLVLAAELETAPDAATTALAARLRAGPRPVPHNLPPAAVPFVGREAELGALAEQLADPASRVLSLVGLGGSGKTRLALEAARRFADPAGALDEHPFPDGVYLVPLGDEPPCAAEDEAAARIARAIAGALGVALDGAADPTAQLARALRDRALLLVLDNLEHLVDGSTALWHLVRQAPRVKLMVTSRVRLRLLGEWELEVRGLPVPAGPGDLEWAAAGVLFLQQARRAQPGLEPDALGAADRAAVVRICHAVGGLPLPLVLAAAWSPVLSCAEIAGELEAAVEVPEAPLRGLPARQRRMCDVLGAAWDRLPDADQDVLRWLPLFRESFTREAARTVVGASPQQLLALLDCFLVVPGEGGRYELNEQVRRFAVRQQAGRPDERARLAARHAAHFATLVQERAAALPRSRQALAELEHERANILAAWEWAAANGHADLLARMRPGLLQFHQLATPGVAGEPALPPGPEHLLGSGGASVEVRAPAAALR